MGSGRLIKAAIKKYGVENFIKEILHVFDNEQSAINHKKNLTRGWNLTDIVEKEVYTI